MAETLLRWYNPTTCETALHWRVPPGPGWLPFDQAHLPDYYDRCIRAGVGWNWRSLAALPGSNITGSLAGPSSPAGECASPPCNPLSWWSDSGVSGAGSAPSGSPAPGGGSSSASNTTCTNCTARYALIAGAILLVWWLT